MLKQHINKEVVMASEDQPLHEVTHLFRKKNVGSVIVVQNKETNPTPIGIITDRDIVTRLLSEDGTLKKITALDAASRPIVTVKEDQGMESILMLMAEKCIRRVPVVNQEGKLSGMVSLDDLLLCVGGKLQKLTEIVKRQVC